MQACAVKVRTYHGRFVQENFFLSWQTKLSKMVATYHKDIISLHTRGTPSPRNRGDPLWGTEQ